jgi:DNA-binding transcriptional ArsR family regulator
MSDLTKRAAALSCPKRELVLQWLREPARHFPPQVEGDILFDGVCGDYIAKKLKVSRATASQHMKILVSVGFVTTKRLGRYTYFKRVDAALSAFSRDVLTL